MGHIIWEEQWVEVFSIFFLVSGFIAAVLLNNVWLSYLTIFLAGLVAGRIYYIKSLKEPTLPFMLIIIGFFLGYWIGAVWVSRLGVLLIFAASFGASYYLHFKKIIVIFKSRNFVK
jgi:hypothetical protein